MTDSDWDALQLEIRELAARVSRLEKHCGMEMPHQPQPAQVIEEAPPQLADAEQLVPILGRSLLGLAGAYLLRALTESGTLGAAAGVATGLLYAMGWLALAARTPAGRRVEAALYALTSALVLAPLLWEATERFHTIGTWTAAGVLLFSTLFGLAVSWRKNLLILATISTLTGLGTAGALLIATHDVLPFTVTYLAIAAAVEVSACLDHWLSERWLAATAANLSVLLATWLVTNERGLPPAYSPIPKAALLAAQLALPAIYLSSTIFRTLLRRYTFTVFETAQCAAAVVLALVGALRLFPGVAWIGVPILIGSAACYAVAFARLDREDSRRNFYVYSTFGILLALAGCLVLLSAPAATGVWSLLAIACTWSGKLHERFTLQLHGAIYLLLAVAAAGALREAAEALIGPPGYAEQHVLVSFAAILATAICCGLLLPQSPVLRLALSATLILLMAGVTATGLAGAYHHLLGAEASHAYCATGRTAVLAAAALLSAFAGSRWRRPEISRLIYPLMLLGAYRLVAQDLRHDVKPALILSLLVYGATLTVLPKFVRRPAAAGRG
jgi:hypothetical protein